MQKKISVRLNEILNIDLLADAEILAGGSGLGNKITSVNVWEVPDIAEWVRPGELLLTTAYPVAEKIDSLPDLIPLFKKKGVCGLGIKTKRYIDEVPDEVVHIANLLDFPIIRIPKGVSFGDLIKSILVYIVGEQTRLLEQINVFNERLKAIMSKHGGMDQFAEEIYALVKAPLAISDDLFKHYVIYTGHEEGPLYMADEIDEIMLAPDKSIESRRNEIRTSYDIIGGQEVKRITIPTVFDNVQYGKIMIWDVDNRLTENDIFIIESASSLIALNTITRVTLVERENIHYVNFIEQLLSGEPALMEKAASEATYFGFHPEQEHQCIILNLKREITASEKINDGSLPKFITTSLLRIMHHVKANYPYTFTAASKASEVIFILESDPAWTENKKTERCKQFCKLIYEMAKREKLEGEVIIGVGNRYPGYRDLNESHREAALALKVMDTDLRNGRQISYYADLGLLRVFGQPELRKELLVYANSVLEPLSQHDESKDGQLIDTIKAYFKHGGNLRRISEELYTHYNTIIYRINRIRQTYHIDLKDPDTAFNMQLALRIKDLLR